MKLRITNLPRFMLSILIVFGIITTIFSIINKPSLSYGELKYETVFVHSGDTLWGIAEKQKTNNPYFAEKDVREIIYNIKEINNLKTSDLTIGQELLIPQI